MLVPYKYVPHQMERMQEFIDFIFDVWCTAPGAADYSLELFNGNADLKHVMEVFRVTDTKGGDFFNLHVQEIYEHFAGLDAAQIAQLRLWYQGNNNIEAVCANTPALQTVRYSDLAAINAGLAKLLKTFFMGLYSDALLKLAVLKEVIGNIDDHHKMFVTTNNYGKCPFCGLGDMKGEYHEKREAYDHYLPKAHYPFNSINFRNLVPTCHECNSTHKLAKDPVCANGGGRKAFYPYAANAPGIEIMVTLASVDYEKLSPADIDIQFGPDALSEEIDTWRDLYRIDERYKAKCCGENDGKYWVTQILDEWKDDDRTPADFLKTLQKQAAKKPLAESNFLKKAFLEGCEQAGLFEE